MAISHTIIENTAVRKYDKAQFKFVEFEDLFVEIKGDQFKDTDGKLKNVYNPKDLKYKAKFDCAVKHNVIILYYKDIKVYLDFMAQKYGSSWKKLFRAS